MCRCRWRCARGDLTRFAAAIALILLAAPAAADEPAAVEESALDESIVRRSTPATPGLASYEFTINGQAAGDPVLAVQAADGELLVEEAALRRWRVRFPATARSVDVGGVRMVPIGSIAGSRHDLDDARQVMALNVPADALQGSQFDLRPPSATVDRAQRWGAFANYSVFSQWNERAPDTTSGWLELGVFGPAGSGLLSMVANPVTASGTASGVVRLDTAWRTDWPQSLRTLVLGDSFTRVGTSYGRPVRFGGIQFGTNFGLQPGFVTYPLQAIQGAAVAPSTVDIFIDQTKVGSQQVPAGPFSITNVPAANGAGQLQLVVRDMFGREQLLTQDLYGTPLLLAAGLTDFSVSLGAERFDYGIASSNYDGYVASGYVRHGVTDWATVEGRFDADPRVRMVAASTDVQVGKLGVATIGGAYSSADAGTGSSLLVGWDTRRQRFGFGVRAYWASEGFRQVGDTGFAPLESLVTGSVSFNLTNRDAIGFVAAAQRFHFGQPDTTSATLTWSTVIPSWGAFATLSVSHFESTVSSQAVLLTLSLPVGRAGAFVSGSAATSRSDGVTDTRLAASAQKPAPYFAEGTGWRVYGDSDRRVEGGVEMNTSVLRLDAAAAYSPGGSAVRGLVEGGIGTLGGYTFASRPIRDSFAVVSLGGVPGVKVLQENQPVGTTDPKGFVVLERVAAYGFNTVSIDPETTPIGVTVDQVRRTFSPGWRSGELIEFPVRRERNAVIRVNLPTGAPVPAGAAVAVEGVPGATVTGHGGKVFVVGLPDDGGTMTIALPDGACTVRIEGGRGSLDEVPVLGPYSCEPVAR